MRYGSIITEEPIFNGESKPSKRWQKESVEVPDKEHLLTEMLGCMDLILGNNTDELEISIKRNKAGQIMLVKKHRVS